jgi:hypothetical protein
MEAKRRHQMTVTSVTEEDKDLGRTHSQTGVRTLPFGKQHLFQSVLYIADAGELFANPICKFVR